MSTNSGKTRNIKSTSGGKSVDATLFGLSERNRRRLEKKLATKEGRSNG